MLTARHRIGGQYTPKTCPVYSKRRKCVISKKQRFSLRREVRSIVYMRRRTGGFLQLLRVDVLLWLPGQNKQTAEQTPRQPAPTRKQKGNTNRTGSWMKSSWIRVWNRDKISNQRTYDYVVPGPYKYETVRRHCVVCRLVHERYVCVCNVSVLSKPVYPTNNHYTQCMFWFFMAEIRMIYTTINDWDKIMWSQDLRQKNKMCGPKTSEDHTTRSPAQRRGARDTRRLLVTTSY